MGISSFILYFTILILVYPTYTGSTDSFTPSEPYPHSVLLDSTYILYWKYDDLSITFEVKVVYFSYQFLFLFGLRLPRIWQFLGWLERMRCTFESKLPISKSYVAHKNFFQFYFLLHCQFCFIFHQGLCGVSPKLLRITPWSLKLLF